ncbi:kinase, putative [Parvularcula bermudensis HTCC2503]|uniref:Dephospho-CoA kinase n=1 Tax=Parvularcula bermudensis (strain ATCC BAA-594 / HTCC2503 / KCTC 12087) TaxID=314260 RepID=E0TER6_PARBH|nr:dephospho-CoA kinase [Parvularcula bermudensis]ADM08949.1 kinase, putative [Parvularcula bermudensis HTCC2503]
MKRIGLTGGIGMGKSTTADMFKAAGLPVWDADAAVHRLYAPGGAAVDPVLEAFPEAGSSATGVDRQRLSQFVLGDREKLAQLEAIVHPLVAMDRQRFADRAEAEGHEAVVFDIPLLFENGVQDAFDMVVVCSAPEEVRRTRVLARPGMTVEKYESIVARQTPEAEKRALAEVIVPTGEGLDAARAVVDTIVSRLRARAADESR